MGVSRHFGAAATDEEVEVAALVSLQHVIDVQALVAAFARGGHVQRGLAIRRDLERRRRDSQRKGRGHEQLGRRSGETEIAALMFRRAGERDREFSERSVGGDLEVYFHLVLPLGDVLQRRAD